MTTNTEFSEVPRYRNSSDRAICVLSGLLIRPGEEFDWRGWLPQSGFGCEPLNEAAKRLSGYQGRYEKTTGLPRPPVNSDCGGCIFLPEPIIFNPERVHVVADSDAVPGMPRYRALKDIDETKTILGVTRRFPHRTFKRGEVAAIISWPAGNLWDFEPANAAAEAVVKYYEANKDNPRLEPAPFCAFREGIFLPELPVVIRTIREPAPDPVDEFRKQNAEEHRRRRAARSAA